MNRPPVRAMIHRLSAALPLTSGAISRVNADGGPGHGRRQQRLTHPPRRGGGQGGFTTAGCRAS
nr:hypothetical protein [Candidatus Sodalis pierantonius]